MAWLCLACSVEIDPTDPRLKDSTHANYGGCPNCGHRGIPADLNERLDVKITWHELRVLVIWAERWASASSESQSMLKTIYGIADRIQMQHMDQKVGLTFSSELADLRSKCGNVEQNVIKEGEG